MGTVRRRRLCDGGGAGGAGAAAVLSFSLLNADPTDRCATWDFSEFEARHVAPLARTLSPLAALSAESQVLHYTPTKAASEWSGDYAAWVVRHEELPFFVDSEWALESGRPGAQQQQQQLLGPDGRPSAANSFCISSWGGVVVVNAFNGTGDGGDAAGGAAGGAARDGAGAAWGGAAEEPLSAAALERVAGAAASQLRVLFGLGEGPGGGGGGGGDDSGDDGPNGAVAVAHVPARRGGFAAWEVDGLVRCRAAGDTAEAGAALRSLAAVVEELPNLEMPDLIGQQVALSLASLSEALTHAARGAYGAAALAARAARAAAEAAFLHPAVLTQLNFPDSHKLGIYMPLFLPASVPLLQGVAKELLRFRRRRRQYAAAVAAAAAAAAAGAAGAG
ncbi:MAG: phosphatidylinositol-glycan biosynthesis class S protein [Monoraphidium minutum]|nr:MAG: phosphatidylinositol-glycan biosynthesis class S protein [Monoraphidium minutum]